MTTFRGKITVVSILLSAVALIGFFGQADPKVTVHRRPLPPTKDIKIFSFGYNDTMADVYWLRLIQDFDHCESFEGLADATTTELGKGAVCGATDMGWTFEMLDVITRLAPRFYIAYAHGGAILSAIVHDHQGGRLLYDRGIENFPSDWHLKYNAAYHALNELKEPNRAAELLTEAGKQGAPGWVIALAARLYSTSGQAVFAKTVLEQMIESDPESRWAPRLRQRLEQLNEIIKNSTDK